MRFDDKAFELTELELEFQGPLPDEVIDECSVPKNAADKNLGVDPLLENEAVPALAISPGRQHGHRIIIFCCPELFIKVSCCNRIKHAMFIVQGKRSRPCCWMQKRQDTNSKSFCMSFGAFFFCK